MPFSEKQIEFLKKQGISVNQSGDVPESQFEQIEETVSVLLQKHGFGKDYQLTETGKMCESILDAIS